VASPARQARCEQARAPTTRALPISPAALSSRSSAAWCDVAAGDARGWLPGSRIDYLHSGRRSRLSSNFMGLGLAILSFGRSDYWGSHYAGQSWMNDRRWQHERTVQQRGGPSADRNGMPPTRLQRGANQPCTPQAGMVGSKSCRPVSSGPSRQHMPYVAGPAGVPPGSSMTGNRN
jgi:hypothetical protein